MKSLAHQKIAERRTEPQEKGERVIDAVDRVPQEHKTIRVRIVAVSQCRKLLSLAIEVTVTQRVLRMTRAIRQAERVIDLCRSE